VDEFLGEQDEFWVSKKLASDVFDEEVQNLLLLALLAQKTLND